MSAFSDAIQDFFAGLAGLPGGEFGDRVNALLRTIPEVDPDELSWAAGPLVEVIARSEQPRISVLAVLGELLCRGVSFWGVVPPYLAGIRYHLARGAEVEQVIRPLLPPDRRITDLPPDQAQVILEGLPEPAKAQSTSWTFLSYVLGPAMPIFEQVQPFRQLARALGLDAGWLRDSGTGPDWLCRLPEFLDDQADADGPLPEAGPAIDSALAGLRRVSSRPLSSDDAIRLALRPLFEATTFAPPEEFSRATAELARIAASADPGWAGELANVCGGFTERGADPGPGADALIAGLPHLLDPTVAFVEACQARGREGEEGSRVEAHSETVSAEMPEARRALDAISTYCLGTIAHLARSPAARRRHRHNAALLARLNAVRWETGNTGFLWKMLQVLEEELVVLAPVLNMGWKIKINGVGDNFQLHALIGGYLVGLPEQGKYPGRVSTHDQEPAPGPGVPSIPRAIATQLNAPCTGREPGFSSRIQLWNWTALHKDGALPADPQREYEHFIWNEGVPADILPFEGVRVILLGESSIERNWNGGRRFPFMEASFEVVETLTPDAAKGWLDRIAAAKQ